MTRHKITMWVVISTNDFGGDVRIHRHSRANDAAHARRSLMKMYPERGFSDVTRISVLLPDAACLAKEKP